MEHTLHHHLLNSNHQGSFPGHSTATDVCQVPNALTRAADTKHLATVVNLDQKAAFDLADHTTMTAKMVEYGLGNTMVHWLRSYMEQRKYVVQAGVAWSHQRQIGNKGLPQWSVVGSLFFILSQGDLPDVSLQGPQPEGHGVMMVDRDLGEASYTAAPYHCHLLLGKGETQPVENTARVVDRNVGDAFYTPEPHYCHQHQGEGGDKTSGRYSQGDGQGWRSLPTQLPHITATYTEEWRTPQA